MTKKISSNNVPKKALFFISPWYTFLYMGLYRRSIDTREKIMFPLIILLQLYIVGNVALHEGLGLPYVMAVHPDYQLFVYYVIPEVVLTVLGFSLSIAFIGERRTHHPLPIALLISSLLIFPTAVFFPKEFTEFAGDLVSAIMTSV